MPSIIVKPRKKEQILEFLTFDEAALRMRLPKLATKMHERMLEQLE
jgi:hypothetical protein